MLALVPAGMNIDLESGVGGLLSDLFRGLSCWLLTCTRVPALRHGPRALLEPMPLGFKRRCKAIAVVLAVTAPLTGHAARAEEVHQAETECRVELAETMRFTNPQPRTLANACKCILQAQASTLPVDQKDQAVEACIAAVVKEHMTDYARYKFEGLLRDRGLDAVDRERFATCFGSEYWGVSKAIGNERRRASDADARQLIDKCIAQVKATPDPSRRLR